MAFDFSKYGGEEIGGNAKASTQFDFSKYGGEEMPPQQQPLLHPSNVNRDYGTSFQLPQSQSFSESFQKTAFPILGVPRFLQNVGVGIGNLSQGIWNSPISVGSLLSNVSQENPSLKMPVNILEGAVAGYPLQQILSNVKPTDINFQKIVGPTNQTLGDLLTQKAVEYAPLAPLAAKIPEFIGAVGKAPQVLSRLMTSISPKNSSDVLLSHLGDGLSIEDNAKKIAQSISAAANIEKNNVSKLYAPVDAAMQDQSININRYNPKEVSNLGPNLTISNEKYISDPTYQNAHNLQQDLGKQIGYLQKQYNLKQLDSVGQDRLENYINYRNNLIQDIYDTSNSVQPGLGDSYKAGSEYFKKNVVPYYSDKGIADIVTGDVKNPTNDSISRIFKSPEETISKIVGDAGISNNVLYSKLGKYNVSKNPQTLAGAIKMLDQQGFASYVSPETQTLFDALNKTISRSQNLKKAMLYTGLGALGGDLLRKL